MDTRAENTASDRTLVLDGALAAVMQGHVESAYPEEACGGLLGSTNASSGGALEVIEAVPLTNKRANERRRRYLVGPDEVQELERRADEAGLEVIGFYHSHPDAAALPSDYDQKHAWPWYVYLIISLRDGATDELGAWQLSNDRSQFIRVPISER